MWWNQAHKFILLALLQREQYLEPDQFFLNLYLHLIHILMFPLSSLQSSSREPEILASSTNAHVTKRPLLERTWMEFWDRLQKPYTALVYNGALYREGTLSLGYEGQFNTTSIARGQRSYVAHKLGYSHPNILVREYKDLEFSVKWSCHPTQQHCGVWHSLDVSGIVIKIDCTSHK